jgi:hypothetical protein
MVGVREVFGGKRDRFAGAMGWGVGAGIMSPGQMAQLTIHVSGPSISFWMSP